MFTLFCLCSFLYSFAQTDVIVLEKKGENVKTYAAGMQINFATIYNQWFEGTIEAIHHDTIFINGLAFNYKEIAIIRKDRSKLNYRTDGALLMIAGGGVLLLGAVNGLIRGDQVKDWYSSVSFITAGSFLLLGIFLTKSAYKDYRMGKKYTLQYLALGADKK